MKGKWLHKGCLALLACTLFAGCAARPVQETEQRSSLKVMYSHENSFYWKYGDLFAMRRPNIDIEVVDMQRAYRNRATTGMSRDEAIAALIEQEQPDVLWLTMEQYADYAAEGKLMELDALIERDKYDTGSIYPTLLETLREQGGGKLYGLSPYFHGRALFYNADLFAKYGIDPPHDGMTWQEIIDTARRFPTDGGEDTRVYGFGSGDYGLSMADLASFIADTHGLKALDPKTMKMTLNTESWKQAYKLAKEAVDSGAVHNPKDGGFSSGSMEDFYMSQPFVMGRMAMTLSSSYLLTDIKDAKGQVKDYKPFQIGIAAGPVDPAEPDKSRSIYFDEIYAIRANSPNADAAWEFLKFVNGEEYAKVNSRTIDTGLLSRMVGNKEYDGVSLDAFYQLKPKWDGDRVRDDEKIPDDFYDPYQQIVDREIKLVEENKKSVEEALQTIEQEGQAVLDKAVKEAGKKDSTAAPASGDEPTITIIDEGGGELVTSP